MSFKAEHLQMLEKRQAKARAGKVSCMSNSKWEKLFKAVGSSDLSFSGETIKNIGDDQIRGRFSIKTDGLYCETVFRYEDGSECLGPRYSTRDGAGGGPAAYKDIEWIFVPALYGNDLPRLKLLVDGLGKFEYDLDENGFKIYGYR
ncbi:MAG: hypothetical protein FWG66_10775 [Spirochaetes bacterium]|nr:hypothetical protein [Spirochaetota bacterium]